MLRTHRLSGSLGETKWNVNNHRANLHRNLRKIRGERKLRRRNGKGNLGGAKYAKVSKKGKKMGARRKHYMPSHREKSVREGSGKEIGTNLTGVSSRKFPETTAVMKGKTEGDTHPSPTTRQRFKKEKEKKRGKGQQIKERKKKKEHAPEGSAQKRGKSGKKFRGTLRFVFPGRGG